MEILRAFFFTATHIHIDVYAIAHCVLAVRALVALCLHAVLDDLPLVVAFLFTLILGIEVQYMECIMIDQ